MYFVSIRHSRYLEKAKSVIRSLDPNKNQMNNAPHINKLKSELVEKEKYIKQLEVSIDFIYKSVGYHPYIYY